MIVSNAQTNLPLPEEAIEEEPPEQELEPDFNEGKNSSTVSAVDGHWSSSSPSSTPPPPSASTHFQLALQSLGQQLKRPSNFFIEQLTGLAEGGGEAQVEPSSPSSTKATASSTMGLGLNPSNDESR